MLKNYHLALISVAMNTCGDLHQRLRRRPIGPVWLRLSMLKTYHLAFVVVLVTNVLGVSRVGYAQSLDVIATRTAVAPVIDGDLTDAVWDQAVPIVDFRQRFPDQGATPSQRTEVRILFDDTALYIAAWMYDSSPDSIVARLGRRDAQLETDLFGVFIDSHFDRRSGFYFGVSAAGTILDGVLLNDDWEDSSWNGVWDGQVGRNEHGWTAELRIPFSQVRFREQSEPLWGINFRRDVARRNEQIFLVYTPRNESGFVSRFPALRGLKGLNPPRQVEVLLTCRQRVPGRRSVDVAARGSTGSIGLEQVAHRGDVRLEGRASARRRASQLA